MLGTSLNDAYLLVYQVGRRRDAAYDGGAGGTDGTFARPRTDDQAHMNLGRDIGQTEFRLDPGNAGGDQAGHAG